MAKRNASILDILMVIPLWVCVFTDSIIYITSRFIDPALKPESMLSQRLTKAGPSRNKIFSLFFVLGAFLSSLNFFINARRLDARSDIESKRSSSWKPFKLLGVEIDRLHGYKELENMVSGPE